MEMIEEISCTRYDRKIRGQGSNAREGTPIYIIISVKPTTPSATKTSGKREYFKKTNN
jgi:hypothetical protein